MFENMLKHVCTINIEFIHNENKNIFYEEALYRY